MRLAFPRLWVLLACSTTTACGSSSFEVGSEFDDGGADATSDGSVAESTVDDTGGAPDSGSSVDTAVADTAVADTAVADTAVADTAVADTTVADTAVADTAVADTAVADTAVADTAVVDTAVGDTGVVSACSRYVLLGSSGSGLGPTTPMGTIQAAITSLVTAGTSGTVCVAATPSGSTCTTATYNERVTMAEGVSVLGGYKSGAVWTRGDTACVTRIQDVSGASPAAAGVYFGHTITNATVLDGFTLLGLSSTSVTTSAALTMQGGGTVTNNILQGGAAPASYGAFLQAPAAATLPAPVLSRNRITTGTGSASSVGVRVINLAPTITFSTITSTNAPNNSRGIELSGARGAVIADDTIVSGDANGTTGIDVNNETGGLQILRNTITTGLGTSGARGISFNGCSTTGTQALVSANTAITAQGVGSAGTQGVWVQASSAASCTVSIDGNTRIVGRTNAGGSGTGVYCNGATATCNVTNNTKVVGFETATPSGSGRGVHLTAGALGLVQRNGLIQGCQTVVASGGSFVSCVGVHLEGAGASTVDANTFPRNGGTWGVGVLVRWTNALIQNNLVYVDGTTGISLDVRPSTSGGSFEAVVHSNTVILPSTATSSRDSMLLVVDNETVSGPPNGVFRNNLAVCLSSGGNRWAFREFGSYGDPRILENNDFFGCATLYGDRDTMTNITSIATVNALADIPTKGNNLSIDPAFVSGDWHLSASSPAIDKGTSTGCPAKDWDNQSRPAKTGCDIGADEVP